MLRSFIFPLVLLSFAPSLLAEVFSPYSASYDVLYNDFKVGEMSQKLERREDGSYLMQTEAQATGIAAWFSSDRIVERSIWRFEEGRVRPQQYHYYYAGGRKPELEEKLEFDWEAMQITSSYKGKRKQLPLSPGVYDKQLYQLVLRHELAEGLRQFDYKVADRGKLRDYHFEVVASEQVETPFGKLDAVKLAKEETDLWLIEAFDYLLVKLQKSEDGDQVVSRITSKSR